jgi:hypothetical protein
MNKTLLVTRSTSSKYLAPLLKISHKNQNEPQERQWQAVGSVSQDLLKKILHNSDSHLTYINHSLKCTESSSTEVTDVKMAAVSGNQMCNFKMSFSRVPGRFLHYILFSIMF